MYIYFVLLCSVLLFYQLYTINNNLITYNLYFKQLGPVKNFFKRPYKIATLEAF